MYKKNDSTKAVKAQTVLANTRLIRVNVFQNTSGEAPCPVPFPLRVRDLNSTRAGLEFYNYYEYDNLSYLSPLLLSRFLSESYGNVLFGPSQKVILFFF